MAYNITIKKKALQALEKISDPDYSRIKTAIYALSGNPRPNGCKKLKGRLGYRIRVGNYRVVYEIYDAQLMIDVINLGDRKDVYQ